MISLAGSMQGALEFGTLDFADLNTTKEFILTHQEKLYTLVLLLMLPEQMTLLWGPWPARRPRPRGSSPL